MQQRDLAVPTGVRYLRMPVEGEGRIHGAVGPRAFVMPSPDSDLDGPGGLGPRFSARTRFGLPTPGLERSHATYVASLVAVTGSQDE